jgi:hypothetical protein
MYKAFGPIPSTKSKKHTTNQLGRKDHITMKYFHYLCPSKFMSVLGTVAQVYDPCYSEGRDWEDHGSRSAWIKA